METFTLAIVSLILAGGSFMARGKAPLHRLFGLLCLGVFLYRGGAFLQTLGAEYGRFFEQTGILLIPPALIRFIDLLLKGGEGKDRLFYPALILSGVLGILLISPLGNTGYYHPILISYLALAVIYTLLVLWHASFKRKSTADRRLKYLVSGGSAALIIISIHTFFDLGPVALPDLTGAGLLYLIWLAVSYPQLTKLHELMARAGGVLVISLVAAAIFIAVVLAGSKEGHPAFIHVLIASFLVVISISPIRLTLERIFSYFYPEAKDLFVSLYDLDRRLEREKALLLEEMAPVLAHEIRNPLGSIKGAAQYLKSEVGPDQEKLLQVIIEETDRLNRVVSQFLNYAKPFELTPVKQDLAPLINRAISLIAAQVASENIVVEQDIHPDLPPVSIDGEQLMQVILNIAVNAIEAMPAGGVLSIRTSLARQEDQTTVGITIRDTGEGIPRENLKNIFRPFFTTKKRGVGLGLAICRRIIRQHGGHILVKSLPKQGTVFSIRLPAKA